MSRTVKKTEEEKIFLLVFILCARVPCAVRVLPSNIHDNPSAPRSVRTEPVATKK